MKLTKRERILLSGALLIAVVAIFVNYVYVPLRKDIKTLTSQAEEISTQIEDAKQKQALVEVLEKQLTDLQKDVDKSLKDVMKTWDEPEILVYIEQTLEQLGSSNLIENYGVISAEGYLNGDINIKLTATNENLKKILKKFEEGKYFNTVQTMIVAKNTIPDSNGDTKKKELDIELILRFYALDYLTEYTKEYKFMKGKFNKTNIFE